MHHKDSRAVVLSFSSAAADVSDGAAKTRRTHAERREEAERRMLDAAVRIVAERGLEYLTLAECGEAAGYSRGLAAHYFGSRNALIVAIATHIVSSYTRHPKGGSGGQRGIEGFLRAMAFYIDSGRNHPVQLRAFIAVIGSGMTHPTITTAVAELNRKTIESVARGIRQCIKLGEIRADVDPISQATLIAASLRGVMTQWLVDPQHIDLDAIKAELLSSLRRNLSV